MVRLRMRKVEGTFLIALLLLLCVRSIEAQGSNLSKYEVKEREEQFGEIVDVLFSIVEVLVGKGAILKKPIPSSSLIPWPSPTASPFTSYSPVPSLFHKPSPQSRVPSLSPTPTSAVKKEDDLLPSPEEIDEFLGTSEDKNDEVVPKKSESIHFSGVPYPIFMHEARNGEAESAIILLHDFDGEAKDMVPMMDAIQKGMFPQTRFIIPEAKKKLSKYSSKANGWFNGLESRKEGPADKESEMGVASYINKIGDRLVHDGIDRSKIVIIGHGQGSTLALATYLQHEWGGVLGIAGFLSMQDRYLSGLSKASGRGPCVLVSGNQDELIPVGAMENTVSKLEALGKDVSYIEIKGAGHDILTNERVLALAVGLLNRVFATHD